MFNQITILSPGLLGTSVALAVRKQSLAHRITIWARRPETRALCKTQPWCDRVFATPEEAVKRAGLTVVCSPVEAIPPLVTRIASYLKPGALVTDVGSTKNLIVHHCHTVMPPTTAFVGSHPMAGSEKSGLEHARVSLFYGKPCFVTPLLESDPRAVETISAFWERLGMEVTTVSPEIHDQIVANISHLPHILATVLCTYLASQNSTWRRFAGNGLRDTIRIAAGNPTLWKSIIEQNRGEVLRALSEFEKELQAMKVAIASNQPLKILNRLERGKAYCDHLRPTDHRFQADRDPPVPP